MVAITSIEQYEALVSEAKVRGMRRTNNFLTLTALSHYCSHGRVFYEWGEGVLLLYCSEVRYFLVCYYATDDCLFDIPSHPMTMIVRAIGLNNREIVLPNEAYSFESSGFVFRDRSILMRCSLAEMALADSEEIAKSIAKRGYTIVDCPYEKRDEFIMVRNESLEFFHAAHIDAEEWRDRTRTHSFLCLLDSNGHICAVCQTRCDGRSFLLQQLAVSPSLRDTGLGGLLFSFFLSYARAEGSKSVFLWVEGKNHGAIRFYQRMNFSLSEKTTMEYIRLS